MAPGPTSSSVCPPGQINCPPLRTAVEDRLPGLADYLLVFRADAREKELQKLGEALRTATEGQKKKLFPQFKALTVKLVNTIHSQPARYYTLEFSLTGPKLVFNLQNLDSDLRPFLAVLPSLALEQRNELLQEANRFILNPHPEQVDISQHIGRRIIEALHRRPPQAVRQRLLDNIDAGIRMLAGVPFHYGTTGGNYVTRSGNFSGKGLECISYANILINLVCGIPNFSPNVGGMTGATMFARKPEFLQAGISPFPVISRLEMPKVSAEKAEKALRAYGDFFVVQIYSYDGSPFHIVMVYNDGETYMVTEADIGNKVTYGKKFVDWYREYQEAFGFLTFNLIAPARVRNFAFGKSREFMENLRRDVQRVKVKK